jgi:hypothetical protein
MLVTGRPLYSHTIARYSVIAAKPVTVTLVPVPSYTQYHPDVPICVPEPKAALAVYVIVFTGAGVPVSPCFMNTAQREPSPRVQLNANWFVAALVHVTLFACSVGACTPTYFITTHFHAWPESANATYGSPSSTRIDVTSTWRSISRRPHVRRPVPPA